MVKPLAFIKEWMLPIAMISGINLFFIFHFVPALQEYEEVLNKIAKGLQPTLVSIMLFLQFSVVAPTDMKPHKWYVLLIAIQSLSFIGLSFIASGLENGTLRLLAECAMLCLICPTAAAAGVITRKLGGNISEIMTYTVLINATAAVLIPTMIPLIHPDNNLSFMQFFLNIISKVFSILVLPCATAWFLRYTFPKVNNWFAERSGYAFYLWGISLMMALAIATKALIMSKIGIFTIISIGLVSLVCCLFQFWIGRKIGKTYGIPEKITAGQALGQKNTGFFIWLGYSYMTPVTSIAGGFYSIWHNIVNSYQLYLHDRKKRSGQA